MLFSCGTNTGTEVGNPGSTTRKISGSLVASSNNISNNFLIKNVNTSSCIASNGDVSIEFVNTSGTSVSANPLNDGSFETNLDTTQRYQIAFMQNGSTCGMLYYASNQTNAGLFVVLGKGSLDITLGSVTDLGDGYFVANNNPSSYCDDDGDDITDDLDDDANGDGIEDNDEDGDGYLDWYENESEDESVETD